MASTEIDVAREGRGKSQCFVTTGFGHADGLEIVEVNEWKTSFKLRAEALAKRILLVKDAPKKSIQWAKRILNQ